MERYLHRAQVSSSLRLPARIVLVRDLHGLSLPEKEKSADGVLVRQRGEAGLHRVAVSCEQGLPQSARARPHTHNYTLHTHLPLSPPPHAHAAGEQQHQMKTESPAPTLAEPAATPQGQGEQGGGRGERAADAGRAAPSPTGRPRREAGRQLCARPWLPAPPPLRRARGGAGRGVYKAKGGRRSFVSCCSDASGH